MKRFETKPSTSAAAEPEVSWGPWRTPTRILAVKFSLTNNNANTGPRIPVLQVLQGQTVMQSFPAAGPMGMTNASNGSATCAAYPNAGPSNMWLPPPTSADGWTEIAGTIVIPIPDDLVLMPSERLFLNIIGGFTGDIIGNPVLTLESTPTFRL